MTWEKYCQNGWRNKTTGRKITIQQPYTDSNYKDFVIFVDDDPYAWRKGFPFLEYYEKYKDAEQDVLKFIRFR